MTTVNSVSNGLSGTTGTGNFVGANTPTLITPVLGVASATSINFGVSALANYTESGTFTPQFSCVTPGDLSVSYTTQTGIYSRIGNILDLLIGIACTPTFTTASGNIRITNLPVAMVNGNIAIQTNTTSTGITWPAGTTYLSASGTASSTLFNIRASGSNTATAILTMSNIVSGVAISFTFAGTYLI